MEKSFKDFEFLKKYGEKKLLSIKSIPQWPENENHVGDEVSLNFIDGTQLVITSFFASVDTFFNIDEDVVFNIREDCGYEPSSNISDTKIATILVDEKPKSITLYCDEISYANKKISDKVLLFPIGMFIKTERRTIGVCRNVLNAFWLEANYFDADQSLMYSLDERWGTYDDVDSFIVERKSMEYITGKVKTLEKKQFC